MSATAPSETPAIPIRNAWLLLLYASDLAQWSGRFRGLTESAPSLHALLASVLCESLEPLIRRRLGREFVHREETLSGIRGRLQVARSIPHLARRTGRTVCKVRRRSPDTLRNRIVRATLRSLVQDPTLGGDARRRLRELVRALDGVSDVRLDTAMFSRVRLGRSDAAWELPVAVCRMLYRLEVPTETVGDRAMTALLRDEIAFHSVFERFVGTFYRVHHPEWQQPAGTLLWGAETMSTAVNALLPEMHADIVLRHQGPPVRRIVIDTKFYRRTLQSGRWGNERFHSEHLYQIYAYLRTQEHRGPEFERAEGVLLYPTVDRELDAPFVIQGHPIRVKTVNLTEPWEAIALRLAEVLRRTD